MGRPKCRLVPPDDRRQGESRSHPGTADVSAAVQIGVPIAFGTDSAAEPHGLDAREFALMTKNGLPPAQALLTATANAANLLGIGEKTGTLKAGKAANIVAVRGNPLNNIHTTEHPELVMNTGKVYIENGRLVDSSL